MPIAHAMWVHGHSMNIEHPDRIASVWRAGFFGRIIGRSGQSTWIHFPVPTPVIVDDNRLRIESVLVRFRTTPTDAWVAAAHVYDGERKIASHDGLHDAPGAWEVKRFAVPGTPEIRWGVGISINVQFHIDTAVDADSWRIDFSSVGCDFLP
jgi:hypothetical protein